METKRLVPLASTVYSNVYDYACPVDLKDNKIIDILPQVNRQPWDKTYQTYNQQFDLTKQASLTEQMTILFNTGIKILRLSQPQLTQGVIINPADVIVGSGTWVTTGTAFNLTNDYVNYAAGTGSLKFDLAAGGNPSTGGLSNNSMNPLNLQNLFNQSTIFWYVYLPTATDFISCEIQWGSSPTDYYSRTVTQTFEQTVFQNGWNLLGAPWLGATVVGSPNPASISFVATNYTYNGNLQTGVHLDNILCNPGTILNIEYYSSYLFRDAITGAFQETITNDTNLINLATSSYNLLFNLVAFYAVQQQQGLDATLYDGSFFGQEYLKGLARYQAMFKSEVQKPQQSYYKKPNPNYNMWWGRRW